MEKKAEKKELKIVLGVLLTVAVLAVIVAVIVIAVRSAPPQSRFLRGTYDYVDSVIHDGVFVAVKDGEYVLVDEDNEISKRYTFIGYNAKTRVYDFVSPDGYTGELDRGGKELYRRKITGSELSQVNRTTESFYYTEEGGVQTARFGERTLTLKIGERLMSYETAGYPGLPLGSVFYNDAHGDGYLTNMSGAPRFLLSDCRIHSSGLLVTVAADGGNRTYRLPDFSAAPFLDGADAEEILTAPDGTPVRRSLDQAEGETYTVSFANGDAAVSYNVGRMPVRVAAVSGARILIDSGDDLWDLYGSGGREKTGAYQKLTNELFVLDAALYDGRTLAAVTPNLTVTDAKAMRANGVRYVFINGSLYTYKDGALTLKLGAAAGDGGVNYQTYEGKLYFISGGALYDNELEAVAFKSEAGGAAEFARDGADNPLNNLIKKSDSVYADLTGRTVENVRNVHVVYDFSDRPIDGEYLFEAASGAFYDFDGEVMEAGFGTVSRVYRAESGGYMIKTDRGFGAGGTFLPNTVPAGYPALFGNGGVAVYAGAKLETYQVTRGSEFSLTETHYYSNIAIMCSENGITFRDQNALFGFFAKDGKMISGPKYTDILQTENFVLAQMPNGQTRLMDHSGRKLLADQQIINQQPGGSATEYRGFMIVHTVDGKTKMIEANGAVISEYAEHNGAMVSTVTDTADRVYNGPEPEFAEIADSLYTYEKFIMEDGIRILKVTLE